MSVRPDNRLADAPMVPVACRRCGAELLARKSTWDQTSVQWSADASARCQERRDVEKLAGHGRGLFLGCSALRDSLMAAARDGALPIVDDETQLSGVRAAVDPDLGAGDERSVVGGHHRDHRRD